MKKDRRITWIIKEWSERQFLRILQVILCDENWMLKYNRDYAFNCTYLVKLMSEEIFKKWVIFGFREN